MALSLALAKKGIASNILERRDRFSEAGAGIQLGPNAVRVLRYLGVVEDLAPLVGVPREIVVIEGRTARILQRLPLGDWLENRHGAPYWVSHRADLQKALLAAHC